MAPKREDVEQEILSREFQIVQEEELPTVEKRK